MKPIRKDLRIRNFNKDGLWDGYRPVSDADLASLGYVKADDIIPTSAFGAEGWTIRTWSEFDDLAKAKGYVRLPDCEACEGTGVGCILYDEWRLHRRCGLANDPCPSCDGTGFGRLVALDGINVEPLRRFYEDRANDEMVPSREVHRLIAPILAAIDKGETG